MEGPVSGSPPVAPQTQKKRRHGRHRRQDAWASTRARDLRRFEPLAYALGHVAPLEDGAPCAFGGSTQKRVLRFGGSLSGCLGAMLAIFFVSFRFGR